MNLAIIPKDLKSMKAFIGKTREWIHGFLDGNDRAIKTIDFKIKDLKKRKPKLLHETSQYAMQMSINELEEIKKLLRIKGVRKISRYKHEGFCITIM